MVVLVAHGDVLQIAQTAFADVDPRTHRSLEHLETATLRKLHAPRWQPWRPTGSTFRRYLTWSSVA